MGEAVVGAAKVQLLHQRYTVPGKRVGRGGAVGRGVAGGGGMMTSQLESSTPRRSVGADSAKFINLDS